MSETGDGAGESFDHDAVEAGETSIAARLIIPSGTVCSPAGDIAGTLDVILAESSSLKSFDFGPLTSGAEAAIVMVCNSAMRCCTRARLAETFIFHSSRGGRYVFRRPHGVGHKYRSKVAVFPWQVPAGCPAVDAALPTVSTSAATIEALHAGSAHLDRLRRIERCLRSNSCSNGCAGGARHRWLRRGRGGGDIISSAVNVEEM